MDIKNIIELFLGQLKIKYTKSYLNKLYDEHPYKNTLFGISDILSKYNLKTTGLQINTDENMGELNTPFITGINNKFAVVSKITNDNVQYLGEDDRKTIPINDFLNRWNGTILIAEQNNESIEPNYSQHKRVETFNFLRNKVLQVSIVLLSILGIISGHSYSDIGFLMLLSINAGGVYIGYLLLQKQMHISNNHADKICSLLKHGCNSILDSSAAKIMGAIGWSEIGLGYFLSNLCVLLFFSSFSPYLALINCCALPYSLWSVWYQKFIAKEWCLLCLIVQALLWLSFIINLVFDYIYVPRLSFFAIFIVGCLFIMPSAIINILLPYFIDKKQLKAVQLRYSSIKMDAGVFESKLKVQPYYEVNREISQILWGNKDAETLVTLVTNPHCGSCAAIHQQLDNLLDRVGDKICVQYILTSFSEELESSATFLTAVYLSDEIKPDEKREIFNRWFSHGKNNRQDFFDRYDFDITSQTVLDEIESHRRWCKTVSLKGTPTIIMNGHELPEGYNIDDVAYYTDLATNK
ncbi:vitamin K epoxide reductase family protein [Dysgonomonas sp. ZJ279]|uniref:vitamin K epoxide reductase family protein n=1 Tax=Dysgonomonas sp. ZJ279 TaxID=2709796 RepID=UPI0013E9C104|nr:thioredoxin domain-containing protein [Dysgonomonas sp. ZJ279]